MTHYREPNGENGPDVQRQITEEMCLTYKHIKVLNCHDNQEIFEIRKGK